MYIIEIFYSIAFLLAFRYWSVLQIKNIPIWAMPTAFGIKMLVGVVFLILYMHPDTNNSVPSDTMRYLRESGYLHAVFKKSPKDYFTLLFGIGDDTLLVKKYLQNTFLWCSGSYTIVNDSRNIIRLHSVIQFISFGSPYVHALFMSFFALIGLKNLLISFEKFSIVKPIYIFGALLLFPSILFWTSGVLKEPILFLGLGLCARSFLVKEHLFKRIFYGVLSFVILISVKPYVLICVFPAVTFYFLYKYIFNKRIILGLITTFLIGVLVALTFSKTTQKGVQYLSRKQYDFTHIGKGGLFVRGDTSLWYFGPKQYSKFEINIKDTFVIIKKPSYGLIVSLKHNYISKPTTVYPDGKKRLLVYYVGGAMSYIETTPINNSRIQILKNIPEAFINSFFRPLPTDPGSAFKYPAMLEVWLLFFLLIISFSKRRKIDSQTFAIISSLFLFSFFLFLIIGWTTPVIGAIFRYRFPAQLALLIICLLLISPPKKSSE